MERSPTATRIRQALIPGAAVAIFLSTCFLHLSGLFTEDTRDVAMWFLDLPLRALVLLGLADGISRLRTPCERRFWALTLASFSSWFIADMAFQPAGDRSLLLGVLEDGAFLLFYPLLMIAIEQRPCRYHWPIAIDPGQLAQVLINLTLNARAAMAEGGKLKLQVENVAVDHGETDLVEADQYVQFRVEDTGHGMDETTRSRIFEPFFSRRSPVGGAGLGMAVVYGIVKQNAGHITVESTEDVGTTFRVHFPRCQTSDSPEPVAELPETHDPGGSETILLAEDETDVRTAVAEYLRTTGYQVFEAKDGADALQIAESIRGPIHLLISDIVMPKIGGPELAEHLTTVRPNTPVLFVTGYAEDLPMKGMDIADVQVLQKPYSLVTLGATIRRIIDQN